MLAFKTNRFIIFDFAVINKRTVRRLSGISPWQNNRFNNIVK